MKIRIILGILAIAAIPTFANAQTLLAQARPAGSGEWGYINATGELVIPAQYKDCFAFTSTGLAPIYDKKRKSYYFIDTKGNEVSGEVSQFLMRTAFGFGILNYNEGMVPIEVNKKWGYLNAEGKLAVPTKYDYASLFADGVGVVKVGKLFKLVKADGTEVNIEVSGATDVKRFSEGLAPTRNPSDLFGFIGPDGKVVVAPAFKAVGYFKEGLAWAKNADGNVGFINKKGEWAIQPTFKAAKDFAGSGFARVKMDDGWKFVSLTGEVMAISAATSIGNMEEGFAYAKKDDRVGFVNTKGEWAIPAQFEAVKDFKNGYARARKDGQWGFIDTKGAWVVQPTFDNLKDFEKAE